MNSLKEYKIRIEQKSSFPKEIPFALFKQNDIQYGSYVGMHLVNYKVIDNSFVFYRSSSIGRGIKAKFSNDKTSYIDFYLSLPTCSEEIKLFIDICLYFAGYWTCSVIYQNRHITKLQLKELEDSFELENIRLLKNLIADDKNNDDTPLLLSCAKYRLFFGSQEANLLYPVTSSKNFGLWLHTKQEKMIYVPDLMEKGNNYHPTYYIVIPLGVPCLIPNESKYIINNQELNVCFYEDGKELCYIPYDLFLMYLPRQKTYYFDSCQKLVSSFDYGDIACFMNGDEDD